MSEQKLPEMDQQLRKAEAAQRRRLQAEKAAKEAQVHHLTLFFQFLFFPSFHLAIKKYSRILIYMS